MSLITASKVGKEASETTNNTVSYTHSKVDYDQVSCKREETTVTGA